MEYPEYSTNNINNNINIIKIIKDKIKQNKKKETIISKYLNIEYKNFKDFYLINEDWINSQIKANNNVELINPIYPKLENTGSKYSYRIYFGLIDKNDEIMNQLIEMNKNIKNDLFIKKVFFVYGNNKFHHNLYFGILDKVFNIIYFYSIEKEVYTPKFILDYDIFSNMIYDINNYILKKGIEVYLDEIGIDFTKKAKQHLINNELEIKGSFILLNENINIYKSEMHSRNLTSNNAKFYNGIIQCLVNIREFKAIFSNRNYLINNDIIHNNKIITIHFYKLMEYMWNNNNNDNKDYSFSFLTEIQTLSQNFAIFEDIHSLIKYIYKRGGPLFLGYKDIHYD